MSIYFTNTFQNIFTAEKQLGNRQSQLSTNEVFQSKLANIEEVMTNTPDTHLISRNNTKDGSMPFTYFGTDDSNLVFKDFFIFNGMIGYTSNVDNNDISNPGGMTSVDINSNLFYIITAPLEDDIYVCRDINSDCKKKNIKGLSHPTDITTDGTALYITDSGNNRVVKVNNIDELNGEQYTVIAKGFNFPTGITYYNYTTTKNSEPIVHKILFVSDTYNNLVKKITLNNNNPVETIIGLGDSDTCENTAKYCKLNFPTGLVIGEVDRINSLYIADTGNGRILKMSDPGRLDDATIAFTPDDPNLNIGMIKLIFENLAYPGNSLEATNLNDLHKGIYENTSNEFFYKFYTKLSVDAKKICMVNSEEEEECSPYTSIQVDDDLFENGDDIYVNSANAILSISSNSSNPGFTYSIDSSNTEYNAGSYIVLKDNAYSNEQSFDLDLSSATGTLNYNPVTIELYEANPSISPPISTEATEVHNLVLRNGDGILGTEEDIITVHERNMKYPTGLGFSNKLEKTSEANYDIDFTNFDYRSSYSLSGIKFTQNNPILNLNITNAVVDNSTLPPITENYVLTTSF